MRTRKPRINRGALGGPATWLVVSTLALGFPDKSRHRARPTPAPCRGNRVARLVFVSNVSCQETFMDDRSTNAVKHFKFEPRGKRRLHKKPNAGEIDACRRWLFAEIDTLQPRTIVALGATAAQGLVGRPVAVGPNRGKVLEGEEGLRVLVTVHPSSLLRLPDEATRRAAYDVFVADLRVIGGLAARSSEEPSAVGHRDA
jgi:hypothetical protein